MIKITHNEIDCFCDSDYTEDHIYKFIKKHKKFYEEELLNKIESMNLTGTFVDVGSNIGNHTIFFSKFCNTESVISIEIQPQIFKILENNIKINEIDNKCTCLNIGVSNKNGYVKISNIQENNIGRTKIIDFKNGETYTETLDKIIGEKKISLIKIDIEGAEINAIKGATNIITKYKPVLILECQNEASFSEIDSFLTNFGYTTDKMNYSSTPTYIWT